MKLHDFFHPSWQNIRTQPKRHFIVMLVIGMIFGVIFVANFYLQGIENTYQNLANYATDGKVLLIATPSLSNDSPHPEITITDAELAADVEQFGGKVVSKIQRWDNEYGNIVLDAKYLQPDIGVRYDSLPADTAPLLADANMGERLLQQDFPNNLLSIPKHLEYYQRFRKDLIGHTFTDSNGASYYVVGLTSGNYNLLRLPLFDLFEELTGPFPTPTAPSIIINNPSLDPQITTTNQSLIVFENSRQAYQYFLHGHGYFMMVDFPNRTYQVNVIAGMSPETKYVFQVKRFILNIFCIILFVVAVIIIIFTSIRLADQDQPVIQLYSNLGATTKQIRMIYLTYFLILIIGGLLLAFVIASIAVIVYSLTNQSMLSSVFQLSFSLADAPSVILWSNNWEIGGFIIAAILSSSLCLLVNHRRLRRQ